MSERLVRSKIFERIGREWGELDFAVHSIAFSPKDALQRRVVDVAREGFPTTMDVSCWSFIRMAHLAEPLMKRGGTLFTMTYYGSQMVVENYNIMGVAKVALESAVRYIAAELGPKGHTLSSVGPPMADTSKRPLPAVRISLSPGPRSMRPFPNIPTASSPYRKACS
jgi:enoyl-[acyl-carrier protein] reductase I